MASESEQPILELKNVSEYFGGLAAVNDVSFSMKRGELSALIGPNGAGKTTLLHVISGILPPTQGEVWFKGRKLNRLAPHEISRLRIARTYQDGRLFRNMTTLENTLVGCHLGCPASFIMVALRLGQARREERMAKEKAMALLASLGLKKKADLLPSALTAKELKLLGIARALAAEPELLLLDEPVGGLSLEEIAEISDFVLDLHRQGKTIIFVEHRMEMVMKVSKRVIVFNFGSKLVDGTPAEIQRDKEVIAAYLGKKED
jgi:ABC-type branched-subunit amino acid transport system ATPase component